MTTIISIEDEKDKKKLKRLVEDLDKILHILSTSQQALSFFKMYIPAQEIISVMESNKVLFELHRKKYAEKLEEITKKHT